MKNLRTKMKKIVTVLLLLAVCVSCIRVTDTYAASAIRLNKDYVDETIGKKVRLKVLGTKKKVIWSSDNTRVATVNAKGVVTGKRKGEAYIIAKVGNKKLYCDVFFDYKNREDGKNDLYTIPKTLVYHSDYNSKTYKQAEKLMKQADQLEKSYSAAKSDQLWKDFAKAIKGIPTKEYFLLSPTGLTFEKYHHKSSGKRGKYLSGYDQFKYVFYKYLAVNWDHMNDEQRNEFMTNLADSIYELQIAEVRNGYQGEMFVGFLLSESEEVQMCSKRTQRVWEVAENMLERYIRGGCKKLPENGMKPSEYVTKDEQEAADDMKRAEEKRQKEIEMMEQWKEDEKQKSTMDFDYDNTDDYGDYDDPVEYGV